MGNVVEAIYCERKNELGYTEGIFIIAQTLGSLLPLGQRREESMIMIQFDNRKVVSASFCANKYS